MRIRAAAFALALGIATPAIGATSVTDWSEEQFLVAIAELSTNRKTCDRLEIHDHIRMLDLFEMRHEKFKPDPADKSRPQYKHILAAVEEEARAKPATFCWAIEEKYGPQGTVLPGMVRAR